MKNLFNKFKKLYPQTGMAAIMVGLVMTAIIGILAYVIDTGSMYEVRRKVQTAADAAALAGAQELPDASQARIKAQEYAQKYGNVTLPLDEPYIVISGDGYSIEVNPYEENAPLFFSGGAHKTIGAKAAATICSPLSMQGVVPWVAKRANLVYGDEVVLKSYTKTTPGEFQAMDYLKDDDPYDDQDPPPSPYEDYIVTGYPGLICLSETERYDDEFVEPGKMVGPTLHGLDIRLGSDNCTFEDVTKLLDNGEYMVTDTSCPRIVTVPIVESFSANPSIPVRITGFAMFFINSYGEVGVKGKEQSEVTGQFIENMIINNSGPLAEYNGGIRVIRMTE